MRLAVILAVAGLLAAPAHADGDFVPGRVLVRWRTPAAARARAQAVRLGAGLPSVRTARVMAADRLVLETAPTAAATEALIAALRADPDVLYAEPDYIRHRTADPVTPSDPLYPKQWALPMIRAPEAWSRARGSEAVTVAVIDTGAVPHPELTARIAGGYDFITDPANAGDGDGRDGDWSDAGDASDDSSALHGTHVAGIVAASSNNGVGVAGLDWACRLVIVRALGIKRGTGVDSDISAAIRWAAGLHVDGVPDNPTPAAVINMSFGGAGYSQTMQDAVHAAIDAGAVVVAAAGNLAVDAGGDSPAGLDGVITVGAVDPTGTLASYSNFGDAVALLAPGGSPDRDPETGLPEGVLSTIENGTEFTYTYLAGTSQAAPFVSATVSLMKAVDPRLDAATARRLLMQSADPSAQCRNPTDPTRQGCGAGLLDVDAAVVLAGQAALVGGVDPRGGNVVHGGYGCALGGDGAGAAAGLLLVALGLVARRLRRVL